MNPLRFLRPLVYLFLALAFTSLAWTAPATRTRVLIVDGYGNHDWPRTTHYIRCILDQAGIFDVSVSTYPLQQNADAVARWRPRFSDYDVVIQTCNDLNGSGPRWPRPVEKALEDYVSHGGGLYVFHSANNAFAGWPEYNRMIGLGWRNQDFGPALTVNDDGTVVRLPPGEGQGTGHGNRLDALITRIGDHPIGQNLPRTWRAADIEIYRYARGPAENLTVLSYARDPATKLNFPIEWVVAYDQGRVYNSTFGHLWKDQPVPTGLECAGFQTIFVRALQWLAHKDFAPTCPLDFPGTAKPSLRPFPVEDPANAAK